MKGLQKTGGWVLLGIGFVWIAYVTVAVATGVEGLDTMAGLVPAFAFHAIASMAGAGLVGAANARTVREAEAGGEAHAGATPAGV